MFRAWFGGKSTSIITPEEFKAVEDQLDSKVRLLEETSRQLEQSKRQCREVNEKLKVSQQKQDSLTIEITSLQQQLRVSKQENSAGKVLVENGKTSDQTTLNALKQQIAQLTTENKQLKASAAQPLKNNTTSSNNNNQDGITLPRRTSAAKHTESTAMDTNTTSKTNDANSTKQSNHNQELWEQLRDVLIRPSSLVD